MAEIYPATPSDSTSTSLRGMSASEIVAQRKQSTIGARPLLTFPAGLGVHCTLMRFFQYTYGGTSGSTETNLTNIVLPLPRQIQDSFKINVAGDELGILGAGAAQAASDPTSITDIAKSFGANTADALADLSDVASIQGALAMGTDAAQFLAKAALVKIGPDIANGISAGRGTAINPFATLVFKGVDLKVHSLEWLLSPESESESRTLKDIIRTLQRMVLPKVESAIGFESTITAVDRGIMRYPAMVDIYFQGIDMNYYFKFKTSMISQLNVDYTPNGIAINKGGRPSVIRITMTLNEAYIHTADDYELSKAEVEDLINEVTLRESQESVNPEPGAGLTVDDFGFGSEALGTSSVLGNGVNDSTTTIVTSADGQSTAQAASPVQLADEYLVQGVPVSLSQLNSLGISDSEIRLKPDIYIPPPLVGPPVPGS